MTNFTQAESKAQEVVGSSYVIEYILENQEPPHPFEVMSVMGDSVNAFAFARVAELVERIGHDFITNEIPFTTSDAYVLANELELTELASKLHDKILSIFAIANGSPHGKAH